MTTQPPRETNQTEQAKSNQDELLLKSRMAQIGHKLLVLSGKGGVGKSTVAANLAFSLARQGKTVGLLDVDIHGPSIPGIMGLEGGRLTGDGQAILPIQLGERLKVVSTGFLLRGRDEAVIWRGPRKFGAIRQFLTEVLWGRLDYLVVDSPPGTGDEPLSVAQLVGQPCSAVIVTTPQQVAVADVRRCVSFCKDLELEIEGILENMSGFVCPKCGETVELFKSGGGEKLAVEMNVPFLGRVPFEPEIVSSGDEGVPFMAGNRRGPASDAFAAVVDRIIESTHGKNA